jgi:hypothetical protein
MTAVTQSMATSAAQGAAGSVADGSAAAFATAGAPILPVDPGTTAGVAVATAVVAAAVAAGVVVAGSDSGICPNVMQYSVYPGRLDIYFATPLKPFSLDVGGQLKDLVIDRYNDFYGCESPFSRLLLNSTSLRCRDSENECCQLVDTDSGPRLLCELDTISHCVDCWESEPLFWDNSTGVVDSNVTESRYLQEQPQVTTWEESFGCFELTDASVNMTQVRLCLDWVDVRQIDDGSVVVSTENGSPTISPTGQPTRPPTSQPSDLPTSQPSSLPTSPPADQPTRPQTRPQTNPPTREPTVRPTRPPTSRQTKIPTGAPTDRPTRQPTRLPTSPPTDRPTHPPTGLPTNLPTSRPTDPQTASPVAAPTASPPAPSGGPIYSRPWINEVHYENSGGDRGEVRIDLVPGQSL